MPIRAGQVKRLGTIRISLIIAAMTDFLDSLETKNTSHWIPITSWIGFGLNITSWDYKYRGSEKILKVVSVCVFRF